MIMMNVTPSNGSDPQEKTPLLSEAFNSDRSLSERLFLKLTSSQRKIALKNSGIGPAARLIRDAVLGQESYADLWYDPYNNGGKPLKNISSVVCKRILSHRYMERLLVVSGWVLILLTFIEPPHWCRNSNLGQTVAHDNEFGTCKIIMEARGVSADGEENVDLYPNYNTLWLTTKQSWVAEFICFSIISFAEVLRFGREGFELRRFFHKGNFRVHASRCILLVIGFCALITRNTQLNPFIRIVLVASFRHRFLAEIKTLIKMIPRVLPILAVLAIMTGFYAWVGVVLFYGSPQGERDFPNIWDACWTLWMCVTTVNYPDVMMPSYNSHRFAGLYFVSFMVVSFFFLMNLILASIFNTYEEEIENRKKTRKQIQNDNLTEAFHLMDSNPSTGTISRETIMSLFFILNEDFPEIRSLSEDETKMIFGLLDKDGSSTINLGEFLHFGKLLLLDFTKKSDYDTFVERYLPKFAESEQYKVLCRAVKSTKFEAFVDFSLILNALVIGIQSYPLLAGHDVKLDPHYSDGYIDTPWEIIETAFTLLYVIEAILKIMVRGWKQYSEDPRNMFDFIVTMSALVASAYVYYPNAYNDSTLIRFIVMARVLRLGRLLFASRAFKIIGTIAIEILPAARSVALLLFFVMYCFSASGMLLYGGMITRDPSNPLSYAILDTEFSGSDYWANNFNDMTSGMNVLFNLLVVNNFQVCEIGFEAVTGAKWVRFFFLLFHVFGVLMVNNAVVAFIINAFYQQLETFSSKQEEENVTGEAIIRGTRASFDASVITGTETGTSGGYYARYRDVHIDVEVDEKEELKRIFTQSIRQGHGDD